MAEVLLLLLCTENLHMCNKLIIRKLVQTHFLTEKCKTGQVCVGHTST